MPELRRLLDRLRSAGLPLTDSIDAAMRSVDIESFSDHNPVAFWHDRPLVFLETPRGGVKTISAPHMVVTMLHHLEISPGQQVLVLGAKGGYISALIAHMVGPEGTVVVVDPSRDVVEHVRARLQPMRDTHSIRVRKMRSIGRAPPQLPEPLDRVLVTGALSELPNWLETRMSEGGFAIAPMGGRFSQRLIKRERVEQSWMDTDLGGVMFGPVDIADSEPEPLAAENLAEMLLECAEISEELGLLDDEIIERLRLLTEALREMPADLPPLLHTEEFEDEPPWVFDDDDLLEAGHPVIDLLMAEMDWLAPLWPTLLALFDVRMIHPGDPEHGDEDPAGGFGQHIDLVP